MRRITKIGSVAIALLIGVPAFLSLGFFDGASAAGPPLLYSETTFDPVTHIAYPRLTSDPDATYGYVLQEDGGDVLMIRERASGGTPLYTWDGNGRVTSFATDRDGSDYIFGTDTGQIVFVTSKSVSVDTEIVFDTGSPVTAVAVEPNGNWFTATTYHGDVYFFQRQRLLETGTFVWHYKAPLPAGNTPTNPDAYPDALKNLDRDVFGDISLRPYSHVTFAGSGSRDNPTGLFVVAMTAFGELWVFDAAQGAGPEGAAAMRPENHHVGHTECQKLPVSGMDLEVPCSRAATERLLAQLDALSGSAASTAFTTLRQAMSEAVFLDPVYGVIPFGVEAPILDVQATQSSSANGYHLIVVARSDGEVHGLQIHRGASLPSPDTPSTLRPLWRLDQLGELTSLTISNFHAPTGSGRIDLVLGDIDGRVTGYVASGTTQVRPSVGFTHETNAGAIRTVTTARAQLGDPDNTRYLAYVTETGNMGVFDTKRRTETGFPTEVWSGSAPIFGDTSGIAVSRSGSVLVAANGLALYAGMPTVRIDAPAGIKKGTLFEAKAHVEASDSTIVAHDWVLEPPGGGVTRTFSGEQIEHEFSVEGKHTLTLTITDDHGFQAKATHTVSVGGTLPVLKMVAPSRASADEPVIYDFNGTHDPDAAQGLGLDRIEFYPFGNETVIEVPLDTLKVEVVYTDIGEYVADATVHDLDGRTASAEHRITINDGGWCIPDDQSEDGSKTCDDPTPPPDDGPIEDPDDGNNTDGDNSTDDGNTTQNADPTAQFEHTVDGFVLRVDGRGSTDPDGDPLTYHWYFGDGTRTSGATSDHAYALAGEYTVYLVVEDGRGGKDTASVTITIELCGPATPSTADGHVPYTRLSLAHASGHTVSYGAARDDAGRFDVRSPSGSLLHREPAGGPAVTTAAITQDGCHVYLGRSDGSIVYLSVNDPADRTVVQLYPPDEAVAIRHAAVSDDGQHALFVAAPDQVILTKDRLTHWPGNHTIPGEIQAVVSDDDLYNVVLHTTDGRLHLIDGHGRNLDHRSTYDHPGTATALEAAPNTDSFGRGWLFIGLSDGRLISVKMQSHRFYVAGEVSIQQATPVLRIESTPIDREGHYKVGIVTSSSNAACNPETESPCGQLSLIDSRGPYENDVPVVRKKASLDQPPKGFAMNPEARHFLLIRDTRASVDRYDMLWQAPLQTMSGFTGPLRTIVMTDASNAYALLDDGRLVWFYAPPLADFRAGTHDESGLPRWGERLSAKIDTTFDPTPSRSGTGRIVAYHWDFGDGSTSTDPQPVHRYAVQGMYTVQLTLTSRVSSGADTLLVDRYRTALAVWDPPPVAELAATPYNETESAVAITSGETVHFDASGSHDPHGGRIVQYRFKFGDTEGATGSASQKSHTYTRGGIFYASVTVTDDQGFSTTSEKIRVIVANRAPTAHFGWSQPERNETQGWVTYGVPVRFDGGISTDPDGRVQEYEWTFPDGVTKTGQVVWHTFPTISKPEVGLRVRDDSGTWSTVTSTQLVADDGIRLQHTQNPSSGRTINPTTQVTATGLVHDFSAYPEIGNGIPNVKVHVRVYYDGPLGSDPATRPYETKTHLSDNEGKIIHDVAYNQGVAFKPGKYRIQLTAVMEGSANGDTEYSQTTETHFVVT